MVTSAVSLIVRQGETPFSGELHTARGRASTFKPRIAAPCTMADSAYGPGPVTVIVQFSAARLMASAIVRQSAGASGPTVMRVSLASGCDSVPLLAVAVDNPAGPAAGVVPCE